MKLPENCVFSQEHEWVETGKSIAKVGITEYAQSELGDVVFVQLPEVGTEVAQGDSIATVESVKAVSDVYSPIDGKITAVNEDLDASPQLINEYPYEQGWIVTIEVTNAGQLDEIMDAAKYEAYVKEVSE